MSAGGRLQHEELRAERRRRIGSEESKLAKWLIDEFCFHQLSAKKVQRIAMCAVADHTDCPTILKRLSRLGSAGVHPQNCSKDLLALLQKNHSDLPKPLQLCVPMKNVKRKRARRAVEMNVEHSLNCPYLWFSHLYEKERHAFNMMFFGEADVGDGSARLRDFWHKVRDDDPRKVNLLQTLGTQHPDIWSKAIPIALQTGVTVTS